MSERYPSEWKQSCLDFLKARKAALHRRTGYKRMSWKPIRDEIMLDFDEAERRGGYKEWDNRLDKQNLADWESGCEISDEKFAFVDRFIRNIALNDEEGGALEEIRRQKFRFLADATAEIMGARIGPIGDPGGLTSNLPWVCVAEYPGPEMTYTGFIRAIEPRGRIVRVAAGFLAGAVSNLGIKPPKLIEIYEGLLIPLGRSTLHGSSSPIIYSLKLYSQPWRGLAPFAFKEGQLIERRPSFGGEIELIAPNLFSSGPSHELASDAGQEADSFSRKHGLVPSGQITINESDNRNIFKIAENSSDISKIIDVIYKGYAI